MSTKGRKNSKGGVEHVRNRQTDRIELITFHVSGQNLPLMRQPRVQLSELHGDRETS